MMSSDMEDARPANEYSVVSVVETEAPAGADGEDWYRYVIGRGNSTIVGTRCGTRQQVNAHAEAFALELNSRAGGRGRSIWASRAKK